MEKSALLLEILYVLKFGRPLYCI